VAGFNRIRGKRAELFNDRSFDANESLTIAIQQEQVLVGRLVRVP